MKKLNLPIIKCTPLGTKWLSMDDYLKFVNLHSRYILDKKASRKEKKLAAVNTKFSF